MPRRSNGRAPALTGTAAVCVLLAGTRWGSYLGVPPLFLTDLLLAFAALHLLMSRRSRKPATRHGVSAGLWLLLAILLWTAVRLLASPEVTLTAARDLAPYAYVSVAVLALLGLRGSSAAQRSRTVTCLRAALVFHAAWVFITQLVAPGLPERLPALGADVNILSGRADIDTVLVGVLAAWLFADALIGRGRVGLAVLGFAACYCLTFLSSSRAGFIGATLCLLLVLITHWSHGTVGAGRRRTVLVLAPVLVALLVAVLPSTAVGQRLAGTFGLASSSPQAADSAGTTGARQASWARLTDYMYEEPLRLVGGVGFGPDFLADSGAKRLLVGEDPATSTRSPHNYWLGTLARLGLLGVLALLLLAAHVGHVLLACRRRLVDEQLLLVAALIVVGIAFPASVGVVLEAPFGAVPFYWSVGILVAWPRLDRLGGRSGGVIRSLPADADPGRALA